MGILAVSLLSIAAYRDYTRTDSVLWCCDCGQLMHKRVWDVWDIELNSTTRLPDSEVSTIIKKLNKQCQKHDWVISSFYSKKQSGRRSMGHGPSPRLFHFMNKWKEENPETYSSFKTYNPKFVLDVLHRGLSICKIHDQHSQDSRQFFRKFEDTFIRRNSSVDFSWRVRYWKTSNPGPDRLSLDRWFKGLNDEEKSEINE